LSRLGLGAWLDERPALLAGGFGRALLRHIALHHRAAPDDPALLALAGDEPSGLDESLRFWRIALDRWLRRTTGVRLHDLIRRPGHLIAEADRILVRFPIDAADIRLRRHALDIDPGWTPWLGLSVRYVYRDEPLE